MYLNFSKYLNLLIQLKIKFDLEQDEKELNVWVQICAIPRKSSE